MKKKVFSFLLAAAFALTLTGCGNHDNASSGQSSAGTSSASSSGSESAETKDEALRDAEVRFGDNGESFVLHFEDNETAAELAKNITDSGINLPIYHYDDFENYQVMQYYDIPSSHSFDDAPETVTEEKAGEVYYSDPNRIILFYQDAQIQADYTKVGTLETTEGLKEAVENNPVLEGWGTKTIHVDYAD